MGGGVGVDGCDGCDVCATARIGVVAVGVVTDDVIPILVVIFAAGADVSAMETVVIVGDEATVLDAGVVAGCGVVGGAGDGVVGGAIRGDSGGGCESSSIVPTPCA